MGAQMGKLANSPGLRAPTRPITKSVTPLPQLIRRHLHRLLRTQHPRGRLHQRDAKRPRVEGSCPATSLDRAFSSAAASEPGLSASISAVHPLVTESDAETLGDMARRVEPTFGSPGFPYHAPDGGYQKRTCIRTHMSVNMKIMQVVTSTRLLHNDEYLDA